VSGHGSEVLMAVVGHEGCHQRSGNHHSGSVTQKVDHVKSLFQIFSAQVGQIEDAGTHPQLAECGGGFVALIGQDHRTGLAGHGDQAHTNHPGQHPAQLPLGGIRVNRIPVQAVVDRLHMARDVVERLDGDANGSRLHEVLRQVFRQQVGGAFHGCSLPFRGWGVKQFPNTLIQVLQAVEPGGSESMWCCSRHRAAVHTGC